METDEYGLVEMMASVKIPDYSQYFSQCWEEAAGIRRMRNRRHPWRQSGTMRIRRSFARRQKT